MSTSFTSLFSSLSPSRRVVILDGGLGTTLQAPPFSLALDSALWSSELLATSEGRQTLLELHKSFVEAGADVVGTCTYQSSLPLFLPKKDVYASEDVSSARNEMNSALPIVLSSKSRLSALSLGPFGAILQPGQEYTGQYPPPFGPSSTSHFPYDFASTSRANPLPHSSIATTSDTFEDSLAAWHLSRLEDFSQGEGFEKLDLWAFETIPNLREIQAIRRAAGVFNRKRKEKGVAEKPFYISNVYPLRFNEEGGKGDAMFPDPLMEGETELDLVVEATFEDEVSGEGARPGAIGFNCSNPLKALGLVEKLARSVAKIVKVGEAPWLVIYPDGGAIYSPTLRTWSNPEGLTDDKWASLVAEATVAGLNHKREDGETTFGGVMVGGCCKAGPGAIRELRKRCGELGLLA